VSVTISLPGPLRELAGGRAKVDVAGEAATVAEALTALRTQFPVIYDHIMTEQGELRPHVNLFVGMDNIRAIDGLGTPVPADGEIVVLPAVSGG